MVLVEDRATLLGTSGVIALGSALCLTRLVNGGSYGRAAHDYPYEYDAMCDPTE